MKDVIFGEYYLNLSDPKLQNATRINLNCCCKNLARARKADLYKTTEKLSVPK